MSGSSRVSFPHTRPLHSWSVPQTLKVARSVGRMASMPTDHQYSGGFVMSQSSKVDLISGEFSPLLFLSPSFSVTLPTPLFHHSPTPTIYSLTYLNECSRRYCLLGLASISCRITGRYSCRLLALTLPRA